MDSYLATERRKNDRRRGIDRRIGGWSSFNKDKRKSERRTVIRRK